MARSHSGSACQPICFLFHGQRYMHFFFTQTHGTYSKQLKHVPFRPGKRSDEHLNNETPFSLVSLGCCQISAYTVSPRVLSKKKRMHLFPCHRKQLVEGSAFTGSPPHHPHPFIPSRATMWYLEGRIANYFLLPTFFFILRSRGNVQKIAYSYKNTRLKRDGRLCHTIRPFWSKMRHVVGQFRPERSLTILRKMKTFRTVGVLAYPQFDVVVLNGQCAFFAFWT